jgi:transposase
MTSRADSPTVAGIDVSAATLDAMRVGADGGVVMEQFANTAAGHRRMRRWVAAGGGAVRVVLEATGVYHRALTRALARSPGIEVMVANPRAVAAFAQALQPRTRTDRTMASVLCAYAQHMPFRAWCPPPAAAQQLQVVARRLAQLTALHTEEKNRLHALTASGETPAAVLRDVRQALRGVDRRLATLTREAQRLIDGTPALRRAYEHLISIPGIAQTSAIQLLGELALWPPDLTVRQWVASAGLDVRVVQSGTSVHTRPRLSKVGNARIRAALYLPALTALQYEPHVRAFHQQLLARGKAPQQAVAAIMRKLLHAIYGMLKADADWDGSRFRRLPDAA